MDIIAEKLRFQDRFQHQAEVPVSKLGRPGVIDAGHHIFELVFTCINNHGSGSFF